MEDKPRTDLGQAEDKKDLRRAAYRGKVQFYRILLCVKSAKNAEHGFTRHYRVV